MGKFVCFGWVNGFRLLSLSLSPSCLFAWFLLNGWVKSFGARPSPFVLQCAYCYARPSNLVAPENPKFSLDPNP